jgi:pyrimidine-specific ribonucleoside hydrolase
MFLASALKQRRNLVKKIPVIIDCDPGHDDAIALIIAFGSETLDVRAVTTCAGNQTPDKTLNNALRVLSFIDADVTVAQGALKPIIRTLIIAPEVHGESGLDGPELPPPTLKQSPFSALETMVNILTESDEKITLIPTGPLTNIGILLSAYPEVKSKIEKIIMMGGAAKGGNWTPGAEFNILVDPEAADIVFRSGIPIVMCGLDVTHKAMIFRDETEKFRAMGNKTGKLVAELLDFFDLFHRREGFGFTGAPLHDPCAVAFAMDPTLFVTKAYYVEIETSGEHTLGATVVDFKNRYGKPKNVEVVLDLDREKFIDLMVASIRRLI